MTQTEPLRAAATTLCHFAGRFSAGDTDVQRDDLQTAIDDVRAALSQGAAHEERGLDVERLARAMHTMPHHDRGGVDADLAKHACVQFGWEQSRCLSRAKSLAARYLATPEAAPEEGTK